MSAMHRFTRGARGTRRALGVCAFLLLGACSDPSGSTRASALLITLDTTRADALGCYGNARAMTPSLDGLAASGVRFERAYTVTPLTLPAHASMLTGLYPPRHTVRSNGPRPLPERAETLAERATAAGFDTAAFVSAAVLDRRFGLAQGFATFASPSDDEGEWRAHETAARAAAWLDARGDAPFFLWVHFFDPHAPYAPPRELATGALAGEPYLAEVAASDRGVGVLVEALERSGARARTTIVVVGDHGEALGDHGELTHGSLCYEPTLRVPLIVAGAGAPAGAVDERVVSVVDVFPTLAARLGLADGGAGSAGDGRDLLGPADGRRDGAYFEAYSGFASYGWSPLAGWVDAERKYLHSSQPELYDVARDPRESQNLFDEAAAQPYRAAIERVLAAPALAPDSAVTDPALLAQIRALGYADSAREAGDLPHPLAPSDRPAPAQMIHEEARLHEAGELVARGDCTRARGLLEALLTANPHNLFALDMLSACLARAGERDLAIATLERLLAEDPPWPDSHHRLGTLLAEQGRREEALAAFARGLEIDPAHAACRRSMARLLEQDPARSQR
jgi:arylsulfatase A-like enzyme